MRRKARRETSIIFSARSPERSGPSILLSKSLDHSAVASGFLISWATNARYLPRPCEGMGRKIAVPARVRKRTAAPELQGRQAGGHEVSTGLATVHALRIRQVPAKTGSPPHWHCACSRQGAQVNPEELNATVHPSVEHWLARHVPGGDKKESTSHLEI